jgi:hypothetical protein
MIRRIGFTLLAALLFAGTAHAQFQGPPLGPSSAIGSSGDGGGLTVGTTAIANGTSGRILYDNASVLGELPVGTGVASALGNTAGGSGGFALESDLGGYLLLAGGTMAGNIAMGGHSITGAGTITAAFTANGAVALSPASANVVLSPTGSGTVTISPAGALTINPTAASTIDNMSLGVTTPLAIKGTTIQATGTVTFADSGTYSSSGLTTANSILISGTGNQALELKTSGTGTPDFLLQLVAAATPYIRMYDNAGSAGEMMKWTKSAGVTIETPFIATASLTFSGGFTANGSTVLALSNVGPAGAHATVQEWFTVSDGTNTRYIPAF